MNKFAPVFALVWSCLVAGIAQNGWGDRFWIADSGVWGEPQAWASMPNGTPGAGPPSFTQDAHFDGVSGIFDILFDADGTAQTILLDLDNGDGRFDLGEHQLTVRTDIRVAASAGQNNVALFDNGSVTARALSAVGDGTSRLVVGPSTSVLLRKVVLTLPPAFASQLTATGFGAEMVIEGTVVTDDSGIVTVDAGGQLQVDGGVLEVRGNRFDVDTLGDLQLRAGGAVVVDNPLRVGIDGAATVNLESQAGLFSLGPTILGENASSIGEVTVTDAGSRWQMSDPVTVGKDGKGNVQVQNGGLWLGTDPTADISVGTSEGGSGTVTVGAANGLQADFETSSSVFVGGIGGGAGLFQVRPTGSVQIDGQFSAEANAELEISGGEFQASQVTVSQGGQLALSGGGRLEATSIDLQGAVIGAFNDAILVVRGVPGATGSLLVDPVFSFGGQTGQATVQLDHAVAAASNWTLASENETEARMIVEHDTSRLDVSNDLRLGAGVESQATLQIRDGGLVSAEDDVVIGSGLNSTADIQVDGVSSGGTRSVLRSINQGVNAHVIVGRNGTGMLSVTNGGLVQSFNQMSLASGPSGSAVVELLGNSSAMSQLSVGTELGVGGDISADLPGGTASLLVGNRGQVLVGNELKVYPEGTVQVSSGGSLVTDRLQLCGAFSNHGSVTVGTTSVGAIDGDLVVGANGELVLDGGTLTTGRLIQETGALFELRAGQLNLEGGGLQLGSSSFSFGSQAGTPTLSLSQGAEAEVEFAWRMGVEPGTRAQTALRDVGTRLASTGSGGGTDLWIGVEGFGALEVMDGAVVDFHDDILTATESTAVGTVFVRGVADGHRAMLRAMGTTHSDIVIGGAGDGALDVVDGALVEVRDDMVIGQLSGGVGFVSVSGFQDGHHAELHVGNQLSVGAVSSSGAIVDRGFGLLTVATEGEVHVGQVTAVGPDDTLAVVGGNLYTSDLALSGRLAVLIDSPSSAPIEVSGAAQLGGTLEILAGPFAEPAAPGQLVLHDLISTGTLDGSFDTVLYENVDLTMLASPASDGSFQVYVGLSSDGTDGLFRGLTYVDEGLQLANYLALPGDANGDRVVDGQDFVIWNEHKFESGTDWTSGDFNGDGVTDGQDFVVWNSHKFTSVTTLAVPEPSCRGWLGLLAGALCSIRRRTRLGCCTSSG